MVNRWGKTATEWDSVSIRRSRQAIVGYELTIPGASAALLCVRLRPGVLELSSAAANT